jgi:MOSC domain-containing protein YiiM
MSGTILQLSVKPRTSGETGLPKRPVATARVTETGVEGDFNQWRSAHRPGDLDQALLLVTRELLDQLRAEGWPVAPGDLGENLTLDGIAEAALRPGVRLRSGAVVMEVSEACDPCTRLYGLHYVGPERGPAFLRATAGRRGWYARVITPGLLEQGAAIALQAP